MSQFDIVVAGDFNIDLLFKGFAEIPKVGEEVIASGFDMVLGSSAGITASHLAAMGAKVTFVGVVGDDVFGHQLISFLKEAHVNTDYVKIRSGLKTGNTVVMTQGDDRANLTYAGAMATLSQDDLPFDLISKTPRFHMSNPFVLPGIMPFIADVFKRISQEGVQTSLVPQWDVNGRWDLNFGSLLPHLNYLFPNSQELMLLTNEDNLDTAFAQIRTHLKHQVVMTKGREGATIINPEGQISQAGYVNNNPIDCVGAGDAFTAGFLIGKMEGKSDTEALDLACKTGALSTFCSGGERFCNSREEFNMKIDKLL